MTLPFFVAEPALNLKEEVLNREAVCNPLNDVEEPIVDETPVPEVINEVPKKFQFHLPCTTGGDTKEVICFNCRF